MLACAIAAAALAVGCAFDWDFSDSTTGDEGGTPESSLDDRVIPLEASSKDAGEDDAAAHPCTQSFDCAGSVKQYCHFADYSCGTSSKKTVGACTDIPTACPASDEVCACDGKTYPNACTANGMGLDLAKTGCAIDAGTQFTCGGHICTQNKEYCLMGTSPPSYECKAAPISTGVCNPLSCSCQSIIDMKCSCSGDPGSITLTCP